ncbi:MAG TPA: tripartite tricarboxylate transporter substrate binding protein [Burkholderiales bacterium]
MRRLAFLLCSLLFAAVVHAQDFPSRPIRIIVPFAAGGLLDVVAQVVGEGFREKLGQPGVLDHRVGAAGNIGAEAAYRAAPDGYTVFLSPPGPIALNKMLYEHLNYDSDRFEPISILIATPAVLVTYPGVPAKTPAELIAHAKANPGKLNYASPGAGSTPHLATELFQSMTGVELVQVLYKGTAPATTDLVAGRVQLAFAQFSTVLPYIRSGQLRLIAVASEKRSPLFPDVPALNESLPGFFSANFFGLVAPPGTPAEIVNKLSVVAADAIQQPEIAKKLSALTSQPVGNTPAEARVFLEKEKERWGAVIRKANIRIHR